MIECAKIFFVASIVVVATATQQTCGSNWVTNGESCYLLEDEHHSNQWQNGPDYFFARTYCDDLNSHLVQIDSEKENDYLKSFMNSVKGENISGVYIGATRINGRSDWEWEPSGQSLAFTDWAKNNASDSDNCVNLSPEFGYSWIPRNCLEKTDTKFICEQNLCNVPAKCFQGSCYTLSCATFAPKKTSDDDAADSKTYECPRGSLVQIESKEENDFIKSYLSLTKDFVQNVWTAGYDENQEWKWQNSEEPIKFEDWVPGSEDDPSDYSTDDYYVGDGSDDDDYYDDDYFDDYDNAHDDYYGDDYFDDYGNAVDEIERCLSLSRENNWAWEKVHCIEKFPILCEYPDPDGTR